MTREEIIKLIVGNSELANKILITLPAKESRVFIEHHFNNQSFSEIAKTLGFTRTWIYKIHQRAVRLLCHVSRRHIINNFLESVEQGGRGEEDDHTAGT